MNRHNYYNIIINYKGIILVLNEHLQRIVDSHTSRLCCEKLTNVRLHGISHSTRSIDISYMSIAHVPTANQVFHHNHNHRSLIARR